MKDEFGGYYFKAQSETKTLAVIAAYHRAGGEETCSVQIISDDGVWSAGYPAGAYHKTQKGFRIRLGENKFTEKGMELNICREGLSAKGGLRLCSFAPIR